LLPRVLDALADLVPYDMAAVLEIVDQDLVVKCARGPLVTDAINQHQIRLSEHPEIQAALRDGRARVMTEDAHAAGHDPYHDVATLPDGHACLVVPLVAANEPLGVMTFDRTRCETYPQQVVDLATIYGQIIALSLGATRALRARNAQLEAQRRLLQEDSAADHEIAHATDQNMQQLAAAARKVANTDAPVLITGETGTGKEVLARTIHGWSQRAGEAFVKINCAALPENLIESELFGHIKGAFSGATRDRPGRFQVANRGTLLLDEIGDMPLATQVKLLRVLQENVVEPVGSDESVEVDVRIIAATHVDLKAAIAKGRFREDLFYRLNLFPLHLPPLRDRPADIERITHGFLASLARRTGRGPWHVSDAAWGAMQSYRWPGNVRELINALERATILSNSGQLDDIVPASNDASAMPNRKHATDGPWSTLVDVETDHIRRTLDHTKGRLYGNGGAAELLGMKPTTLQSRMRKLGIARVDDT
ncbi:MAG: sigma 54-interacting transcriptional regulator, partial [Myxococcota bacterium]